LARCLGVAVPVAAAGGRAGQEDLPAPLLVSWDGYQDAGLLLGRTGLPAVVVQEGGYHLPTLGGLVATYLDGHARGSSA
jgi:hypothetical protein